MAHPIRPQLVPIFELPEAIAGKIDSSHSDNPSRMRRACVEDIIYGLRVVEPQLFDLSEGLITSTMRGSLISTEKLPRSIVTSMYCGRAVGATALGFPVTKIRKESYAPLTEEAVKTLGLDELTIGAMSSLALTAYDANQGTLDKISNTLTADVPNGLVLEEPIQLVAGWIVFLASAGRAFEQMKQEKYVVHPHPDNTGWDAAFIRLTGTD